MVFFFSPFRSCLLPSRRHHDIQLLRSETRELSADLTNALSLSLSPQFDVICQDLREDRAEASPERAVENCAEHH